MGRPTQITIDIAALRHNVAWVKEKAAGARILAMVKSNAYGHGLVRVASALSLLPEVDALGVASLEEGILLRQAGISRPIVLMEGLFTAEELTLAHEYQFTLVVHHVDQVEMLENRKIPSPLSVWLKIDTGMHRLGFHPKEVQTMYLRLMNCREVKKPVGLMTHFAESDDLNSGMTQNQFAIFAKITAGLAGPRSLANSAAIFSLPETHADWVRPGIVLYGSSPFAQRTGAELGLRPVMTLSSRLIAIHTVAKGEAVGYGCTWVAPQNTVIGVVAVGYGDGYPRHAVNGTPVLVNGVACPLVGRVSMDMVTVNLSAVSNAKIGDAVLLWGDKLPIEKVAEYSQTTAYELLTRIAQRVHIVEVNRESVLVNQGEENAIV